MGLVEDLWARVNQVTSLVNSVVSTAIQATQQITTPAGSEFGGAGGFGGGGAGGVQVVQTPGTVSTGPTGPTVTPTTGTPGPTPQVSSWVPDVSPIVKPIIEPAEYLIEGAYSGFVEYSNELYKRVVAALNTALASVWTSIDKLKGQIVTAIDAAWQLAQKTIQTMLDNMMAVISAGIDDIVTQSRGIYFTIRQYLDGLMQSLLAAVTTLTDEVRRALERVQKDMAAVLAAVSILESPDRFGELLTKSLMLAWQSEVS